MPRRARAIVGGMVHHVLNRAVGRQVIFEADDDYAAFERVLQEAHEREPLRILAYCVMPTHWHFVVWPRMGRDEEVSEFMRWLTVTHTQRWHARFQTTGTGPVYQGRFKSFPVQSDAHLHSVVRYVERNPKRAGLTRRAENWRWSSLWRWARGDAAARALLSPWPDTAGQRPRDWTAIVNRPQTEAELEAMRVCVQRGRPWGDDRWLKRTVSRLDLLHTVRRVGRPRKPVSAATTAEK